MWPPAICAARAERPRASEDPDERAHRVRPVCSLARRPAGFLLIDPATGDTLAAGMIRARATDRERTRPDASGVWYNRVVTPSDPPALRAETARGPATPTSARDARLSRFTGSPGAFATSGTWERASGSAGFHEHLDLRDLEHEAIELRSPAISLISHDQEGPLSERPTSHDTTASPARRRIPRTPAAPRPIGRTSLSVEPNCHSVLRHEKDVITSRRRTHGTSSSPSCKLMAMKPSPGDLSYSLNGVFLT